MTFWLYLIKEENFKVGSQIVKIDNQRTSNWVVPTDCLVPSNRPIKSSSGVMKIL